jgi:hypothetical protein
LGRASESLAVTIPVNKFLPGEALPHVFYEMDMVFKVVHQQQSAGSLDQFQTNLHIESFVVHARNLDEFFRGHRKKHRMKSADFGFIRPTGPRTVLTSESLGRMNDEVCHLGYNRKSPGERWTWNLAAVADPLKDTCLDFIGHLQSQAVFETTPQLLHRMARVHTVIDSVTWPDADDDVPHRR